MYASSVASAWTPAELWTATVSPARVREGTDLGEYRDPTFAGHDLGGDDDSHPVNVHSADDTAL